MTRILLSFRIPVLVFMTTIAGCGPTDDRDIVITSVSGNVTLSGTPLQDGVVELEDRSTGFAAGAKLDADGDFRIERIPAGDYKISVRPPYLTPPDETPPPRPSTMGPIRTIPVKYHAAASSGFSVDVPSDGVTDLDLELKE